jgi:hypothetical protein
MKVNKFKDENLKDIAVRLADKFFKDCRSFGSTHFEIHESEVYGKTPVIGIYFDIVNQTELKQIIKCKKYLKGYFEEFYNESTRVDGIALNIVMTMDKAINLKEKLDLEDSASQYNL